MDEDIDRAASVQPSVSDLFRQPRPGHLRIKTEHRLSVFRLVTVERQIQIQHQVDEMCQQDLVVGADQICVDLFTDTWLSY